MFKNFNWGHGIFIFYICFVAAVVTALIASFSVDHSLVVDDYYAKDLTYQSQYEKTQNGMETAIVDINNNAEEKALTIDFLKAEKVEGTAQFYRPSDKSKDFEVKLTQTKTSIATDEMLPGKWVVKIDWSENGKPYYTEEIIFI